MDSRHTYYADWSLTMVRYSIESNKNSHEKASEREREKKYENAHINNGTSSKCESPW